MTIGDLRASIEGLPDNMDLVVAHGDQALWVAGLGTAVMGTPAGFGDNSLVLVKGVTVFEVTARDHA